MNEIKNESVIETISKTGRTLVSHLKQMAQKYSFAVDMAGHGFDCTLNFNYGLLSNKMMILFIQEMVARGIYTNGVFYPCYMHTDDDAEKIFSATDEVFALLKQGIEKNNIEQLLKARERQTGF